LIVASGLDARPYRLSWPAGATVTSAQWPGNLRPSNSRTTSSLIAGASTAAGLEPLQDYEQGSTAAILNFVRAVEK
jgi:hypothetical protein